MVTVNINVLFNPKFYNRFNQCFFVLLEFVRIKDLLDVVRSEMKWVKCTLQPDLTTNRPIYGIGLIPRYMETWLVTILQGDATTDTYPMDQIFPTSKYLIKRANINEEAHAVSTLNG